MRKLFAIIVIAFLATTAGAEEFQVGFRSDLEYDSNLFNSQDNETADTAVRVTPIIGLRRKQGRLVYDVKYQPRFETWLDGSTDDDWDQNLFGRVSWQMSARTTLRATERFLLTKSQSRAGFIEDPSDPGATPVSDVAVARQQITRNLLSFGADHVFTPRIQGSVDLGYDIFRTDQQDRFENDVWRGSAQASYALSGRNRVGAGFGITYNNVMDTDTQPGSQTFFYNLFATWVYQFDPTMTLNVQAGPTFIDSQQSGSAPQSATVASYPFRATTGGGIRLIDSTTCPTQDDQPFLTQQCGLFAQELTGADAAFIQGSQTEVFQADDRSGSEVQTTIFATIRFTKAWEHVRLSLGYRRSDSSASGVGQSTVLDFLDAGLTWVPTPIWEVRLLGSFANRQSATNQSANTIGLGPPMALVLSGPMGISVVNASPSVNLVQPESDDLTNVQTWQASLLVFRYIGSAKRARAFARVSYLTQDGDSFGQQRQFDDYRVGVGFEYLFDWMKLW